MFKLIVELWKRWKYRNEPECRICYQRQWQGDCSWCQIHKGEQAEDMIKAVRVFPIYSYGVGLTQEQKDYIESILPKDGGRTN